jgi:hypothetical protein
VPKEPLRVIQSRPEPAQKSAHGKRRQTDPRFTQRASKNMPSDLIMQINFAVSKINTKPERKNQLCTLIQ